MNTAVLDQSGVCSQGVDLVDDELLLVERVRVPGVAVLVAGRLEEAHAQAGDRATGSRG